MKSIVNKVKEQIVTTKPSLATLVSQLIKKTEFNFEDENDLNEIVTLLQKDIDLRTQVDIDRIGLAFHRVKFFHDLKAKMGSDIFASIYKQLVFETADARQLIFNVGDIGKKFYIIIKGTVQVLIKKKGLQDGSMPTEEELKQEEKEKRRSHRKFTHNLRKQQKLSSFTTQQEPMSPQNLYANLTDAEYFSLLYPHLIIVSSLTNGQSFGELALTQSAPRAATIVASTKVYFATLTREQFSKLLLAHYQQVQQRNIMFLTKIPILCEWTEAMLNQLYYHFTFQNKDMLSVIYHEGQPSKEIYLVYEGEIELSELIVVNSINDKHLSTASARYVASKDKKYTRIKTSIVTRGQFFGHEEVLAETDRTKKAVCISPKAHLFVIDKERFLQYFQKGDALEKLQLLELKKQSVRGKSMELIKEIKKPLIVLPYRDIPYSEEKDLLKNCAIKKVQCEVQRIGNDKHSGYELLQGKGHTSKAHYNFHKNIDTIQRNTKTTMPLSLEQALFAIDSNKGSSISIMNKVYPGASRGTYEIPDPSMSTKLVIKALRLPKILTEVENAMGHKIPTFTGFSTFTYQSQPTVMKFSEKTQEQQLTELL